MLDRVDARDLVDDLLHLLPVAAGRDERDVEFRVGTPPSRSHS
jgi:hypothetical protein